MLDEVRHADPSAEARNLAVRLEFSEDRFHLRGREPNVKSRPS